MHPAQVMPGTTRLISCAAGMAEVWVSRRKVSLTPGEWEPVGRVQELVRFEP